MLNVTDSVNQVISCVKNLNSNPNALNELFDLQKNVEIGTVGVAIQEIEENYTGEEKDIIEIYRILFGIAIKRLQEAFEIASKREYALAYTHLDYLSGTVLDLIYSLEIVGCFHLFPEYVIACKNMLLLNAPLDMLVKTREDWKNDANFMMPLTGSVNTYKFINDIVKERYLVLGLKEYENVLNSKYSNLNSLMLKYRDYLKIYGDCENMYPFPEYQEDKKREDLEKILKR